MIGGHCTWFSGRGNYPQATGTRPPAGRGGGGVLSVTTPGASHPGVVPRVWGKLAVPAGECLRHAGAEQDALAVGRTVLAPVSACDAGGPPAAGSHGRDPTNERALASAYRETQRDA